MISYSYQLLLLLLVFATSVNTFVPFKDGMEYVFEFKTETINKIQGSVVKELIQMDIYVRTHKDGLVARMSGIKTSDFMPLTPDQVSKFEEPFKILLDENKRFAGIATTDTKVDGPVFRRASILFLFDNPNDYGRYLDKDFKYEDREITLPLGRCLAVIHRSVKTDEIIVTAEARKDDCDIIPALKVSTQGKSFASMMTDTSTTSEIITLDKTTNTIKKIEQLLNAKFKKGNNIDSVNRSTYLHLKKISPVSDSMRLAKKLKTYSREELDRIMGGVLSKL